MIEFGQKLRTLRKERNLTQFINIFYKGDMQMITATHYKIIIVTTSGNKSDYIKPNEHIDSITLNQKLQTGIYKNCKMVYNCYTLNTAKTPLNSGEFAIEINSI